MATAVDPSSAAVEAPPRRRTSAAPLRVCDPEATYERVSRMLGPLGISRVSNVTGLDCIGVPVTMACRPNARSMSVSPGRGATLTAAKVSAIMEAIELYHAERPDLLLRLSSWDELSCQGEIVDVERLPLISISRFTRSTKLLWCQGRDLVSRRTVWVPYEVVHTDFTLPLPSGAGCFAMGSNGLAAGNHVLEAIVHGLTELIERDAHSIFRALSDAERDARQIDLQSVHDADCCRLIEQYQRAGLSVAAWNLTSDVGIPVCMCLVHERDPSPFRMVGTAYGLGCQLRRQSALFSALTEAAQGRLTLITGTRDDCGHALHASAHQPQRIERVLRTLQREGTLPFASLPSFECDELSGELSLLLDCLRRVDMGQVVVVDLTKDAFRIPVVRMVVPGLEGHHHVPGYVPGPRVRTVIDARGGVS